MPSKPSGLKQQLKNIYQHLPLKQQVFSVLKHLNPPHRIYKHLHFNGEICIQSDKQHSFKMIHYGYEVENSLFWAGLFGWEKLSLNLWKQLSKSSNVILDIGANTGVYSLLAKSLNPQAKIYGFEPVARVYEKYKRNCLLNNYDIQTEQLALSDKDGDAIFYDLPVDHIYSVCVNKDISMPGSNTIPTKVKIQKLSTYIEDNKIPKIDLMKVDVETHEPEVLLGMGHYLRLYKPTMLIEILNPEIGRKIENILDGLGYIYFDLDEKTSPRQVTAPTQSSKFNYLICQPNIAQKIGLL